MLHVTHALSEVCGGGARSAMDLQVMGLQIQGRVLSAMHAWGRGGKLCPCCEVEHLEGFLAACISDEKSQKGAEVWFLMRTSTLFCMQ